MQEQIQKTNVSKENKSLLMLMNKKIEEYIFLDKSICIILEGSYMNCRNTIKIETYEIYEDYISFIDENFEVHIKLNETTIITYQENLEEYFKISQDGMKFYLYFI